MGVERWFLAVVDGCRLLDRARVDPEFGEFLMMPGDFGPGRRGSGRGGLAAEFRAEVDAMNRLHPGVEDRIFTVDKDFDLLHYLLSAERRRGEFAGDDPGTWAILGARGLPDHLRGGQGHPIRYSTPGDVAEIAAWLGGRTAEDLRSAHDPAAMEEQCVYKFWAGRDDAGTWGGIVGYFEGLRAFYVDVAAHGEGVLAIAT